jgi:hypothetical protein
VNKYNIYAALGVAELWRYDGEVLKFYQCLIAAITFAESGELEPLFSWEEDESLVTA